MENDSWLAKEILASDKQFYFVRPMIDNDIENDKKIHRSCHNPNTVLEHIRSDCIKKLKETGMLETKVFLVNNYDADHFDFHKLFSQLKNDAPESKKQALILCFAAISPETIEEKCKLLTKRIYKVTFLSSIASTIPIPGTGIAVDFMLMKTESEFYREQLGTNEESLKAIAKHLNVSLDDLISKEDLQSSIVFRSKVAFVNYFSSLLIFKNVENVSKVVLPFLGSIVLIVTTYPASVVIQKRLLQLCKEEAFRLLKFKSIYINKQQSETTEEI
ncbi:hypothetical protein DPMN_045078 [Dreissena polymorpha]|uniref:Uncharacterized protein n=1 Tax=Dreissena polymorpha TaxID=45954 RepID=A0A9D4HZB3_DREPO|nr:hypothetical protein DPMN_045078 [Dreissena polymorpha]